MYVFAKNNIYIYIYIYTNIYTCHAYAYAAVLSYASLYPHARNDGRLLHDLRRRLGLRQTETGPAGGQAVA